MRDHPARVLVVEDDGVTARVTREILQNGGYAVTVAETGEQALQQVGDVHPDVILLDLLLPGKDGLEVARELAARAETRDIPIVVVTGADSFPSGGGFNDLDNISRFLYKPVQERSLVPAIDEALLRHPEGDHR